MAVLSYLVSQKIHLLFSREGEVGQRGEKFL